MASVQVNMSASLPAKAFCRRKLTGYTASATFPLKASTSFPLKASASVPLRASDVDKVSGNKKLTNFKSDYVFIFYSGPENLKRYDRMDFGLYGRSWLANASWSLVFAPGVNEDNWKDYLLPAKSNFMDTGDLLNVVGSGSSNGLLFAVSAKGFQKRAVHGIRTLIPLDEVKNDSRLKAGGSLLVNIALLAMNEDGEVRADTDYTFDGYVSWNLYLS
ncbi:hypothetical protein CICLE_v10012726mg [Citrus x clementina]|uniref:Uncharacterized protein n=2 Tax=Citrus TaxID=2706 RepID=V4SZD8_CITCL|nr:uncharacterized protein LOC18039298 [Citrus x clementina]ESR42616.1 hypothetical protein CICLE_v10012726mg [Citrus x clementina]GAY65013.1 hypothetical protein CUMW_237990 [Citrus unshiu]